MFKYLLLMLVFIPNWALGVEYKHTYAAASLVNPGTTPTDICVLGGSATKLIRVLQVQISGTQTTAGSNRWYLVKRSTSFPTYTNQGSTMTAVPMAITMKASTASAITLTQNADTLGTLVGSIQGAIVPSPVATTAGLGNSVVTWNFGSNDLAAPPTLLSATDSIALNFNGAALPTGLSIFCSFMWTEE